MPEPPGDLRSRVWRSIREAEAEEEAPRAWIPSFWPDWMVRPAFAIALVTVTFGAGVVLGSVRAKEGPPLASAGDRGMRLEAFEVGGLGSPYDRLFSRQ